MYLKHFIALAALSLFVFASCRTARKPATFDAVPVVHTAPPATVNSGDSTKLSNSTLNKNVVTATRPGDSTPIKKVISQIIEKGGKYVMITPSYMRLKPEAGAEEYDSTALQQKINSLKKYAFAYHYNSRLAFLIDMHVKSNRNRFFVVNLQTGAITQQGLVAHGRGTEKFTFNHHYSNGLGSNCTSLGIYKIGKGYNGAFGLSYKLFGLEKTNSNASQRYVVLHAMGAVPEQESKFPIVQSEGCPAVAPAFLAGLATLIDHADNNILLCIYDSTK